VLGKRRNEAAHEPLVSRVLWQRVQSSKSIVRNGTMVAGIAGGLLRCESCGGRLKVTNGGSYGCRRRSVAGKCSRPMYVSKAIADAYVERLIVELLDSGEGIDYVASARDIEQARVAWQAAIDSRARFADFLDTLDPEDFRKGYAKRQEVEQAAHEHYQDLLSRADEASDGFPASGSAWRRLDEAHQRLVARQLIERVTVSAPLAHGKNSPVERRFHIVAVGGVELASTGRQLVAV
jgi:hypothetical protein